MTTPCQDAAKRLTAPHVPHGRFNLSRFRAASAKRLKTLFLWTGTAVRMV